MRFKNMVDSHWQASDDNVFQCRKDMIFIPDNEGRNT